MSLHAAQNLVAAFLQHGQEPMADVAGLFGMVLVLRCDKCTSAMVEVDEMDCDGLKCSCLWKMKVRGGRANEVYIARHARDRPCGSIHSKL